jgi:hypothetical protein
MCFIGWRQQLARDIALLVDCKQILFQTEEEILGLPFLGRRANPQAGTRKSLPKRLTRGGKSVLQPRFQFGLQVRVKQPLHIALPRDDGWLLFPLHKIQI